MPAQTRQACALPTRRVRLTQRPHPQPRAAPIRLTQRPLRRLQGREGRAIDRKHVCAGGVVYRLGGPEPEVLLILDRSGNWTLPKGHLEAGETPVQAAVREVREETGVTAEIGELVGQTVYTFPGPAGMEEKVVHYFLMTVPETAAATAQPEEGVQAVRWVAAAKAAAGAGYSNIRALLAVAALRLAGHGMKRPAR